MERTDLADVLRPLANRSGMAGNPYGYCIVLEKDVPLDQLEAVTAWLIEEDVRLEPSAPLDRGTPLQAGTAPETVMTEPCWRIPLSLLGLG